MCWHKWTKWETYIQEGVMQRHPFAKEMLPFAEERQTRYCIKCGLKQTRTVRAY